MYLAAIRYAAIQRSVQAYADAFTAARIIVEATAVNARLAASIVPVEYAVAVDRYLDAAELGPASRRVYRISLTGWAWPLVGKQPPAGSDRRKASPPILPLALLDHREAHERLAAAVAYRVRHAQARTVNREISALSSAIGWWRGQQWIGTDAAAALRHVSSQPASLGPLTRAQREALFAVPAGLREQAFWRLLQDSGWPAVAVLALDADAIDTAGQWARTSAGRLEFSARTGELLSWLLAGRPRGPAFLTDRRAPAGSRSADVCALTGRARLSYRRAAEIFTEHTRPLDPAGTGWTLHQLRQTAGLTCGPRTLRPR
jgi:hypothetical protein